MKWSYTSGKIHVSSDEEEQQFLLEELIEEAHEESDIKLSRFQQHGVKRALRILDKYHGVMIADGVGLGKNQFDGMPRQCVVTLCHSAKPRFY